MKKVLRCDCGFEVHADDESTLVAEVRRHALGEHGMQLSAEEAFHVAFRPNREEIRDEPQIELDTHESDAVD